MYYPFSNKLPLDCLSLKNNCYIFKSRTFLFAMKHIFTASLAFIGLTLVCTSCGNPLAPKVRFSSDYQTQNRQKVTIEMPETYELSCILMALTGYRNVLEQKDPYIQDIKTHFSPYKDHPMVRHVAKKLRKLGLLHHTQLRKSAITVEFNDQNRLEKSKVYSLKRPLSMLLLDLKDRPALLRDFIEKTNYRAFYAQHQSYYQDQLAKAEKYMPISKMWKWAESQFPSRYDSYKIYLSSLDGGHHFTFHLNEDGFRQTLMFISPANSPSNRSEFEKEGAWSRIVFTEIDHNYVNPVTDKYQKEIEAAMPDWKKWNNTKEGNKGYYESTYLTFNEYMTWAVFTLYAYDSYPVADFEKINQRVEEFMINGRGFHRYKEFNRFLLETYQKRAPNQTVADLYPAVIDWLKQQP